MEQVNPIIGLADPQRTGNTYYQIKPGYVVREIAGEYLAVPVALQDEAESRIAVLNSWGKFLWEQLQQGQTVVGLVHAMTDCYEVSATEAERDILEFLDQLKQNKLLLEVRK